MDKRTLNITELEAQTALELPDRELPLVFIPVTVIIGDVTVVVPINAAANICGVQAAVLAALFFQNQEVECTATAGGGNGNGGGGN